MFMFFFIKEEMAQKYRELTKKEAQMDEFLNGFEDSKRKETEQLYSTRRSILNYLELSSKAITKMNKESGDGGGRKSGKDAEYTVADLRKVEELEKKVTLEYETSKEKRKKMEEELVTFSDLEGLKRKSENRKQQLVVEKQNLSRYKDNVKHELKALQSQFEAIQAQLFDNETHTQLINLEKKLQSLEQSNFSIKDKITSATTESDYDVLKSQVLQLVSEHNKWLQKQLLNPGYGQTSY
jgi:hypothetical protein